MEKTDPLLLRARRSGPLRGRCQVPGDKSISHRALLFGALCDGPLQIEGLGSGGDNASTARALRALGVSVELEPGNGGRGLVRGVGLRGLSAAPESLDCGNSGTTIRLLTGLLAGQPFTTTLHGDASLTRRPMRRLATPLRQMGATIDGRIEPGKPDDIYPPLVVTGGNLRGIHVSLPVASAQLKTALVLAGLQAHGPTEIVEPGLSRDHTERMLTYLGAPIQTDPVARAVRVDPAGWDGRLRAGPVKIPGDLSSAAFLMVAALIVPGSDITIDNVGLNPTRAGVIDALRAMGGDLQVELTGGAMGEPVGSIRVRSSQLRGIRVDGALALRAIDEMPALAVAAAVAHGETTFAELQELRIKESDRIAAMARELGRAGLSVTEHPDGLTVTGQGGDGASIGGGTVLPMHDHRIAMSGMVLGLVADSETVVAAEEIATSFPTFAAVLRDLGAALT